MVCGYASRAPGIILRPRRSGGTSVRPLNFTVRSHQVAVPHSTSALRQVGVALAWTLTGAAALLWALFAGRTLSLLLWVVAVATIATPRLRREFWPSLVVIAALLVSAWSPLDITFVRTALPPHLVHCCPGPDATWQDYHRRIAQQSVGSCYACSDLAGPAGSAKWYLVW